MSGTTKKNRSRFKQEAAREARLVRRRVGLILLLFLLLGQLGSIYTSYLATRMPRQGAQLRSFELALSQAYGWLSTAESAERGMVFAGLVRSDDDVETSLSRAREQMSRAWILGQPVPSLRENLTGIRSAFDAKAEWIENVQATQRREGKPAAAALIRTGRGRALMDEVRRRMERTNALEAPFARQDEELARLYGKIDVWSGVVVTLVGLLLAASLYFLSERVGRSEAELVELQNERTSALEKEVGKRTAQLQLANGDLEAFSLITARAVLREVDEIAKSLRGRDDLTSVQEHAQELRQTLNSVLLLGKLSRESGPTEAVDLGNVLHKELADREPIPGIVVQIADGAVAQVNEKGMRILFRALVDSAWPALRESSAPALEFSAHDGTFVFRHSGTGTLPVEVWDLLPAQSVEEVRQVDIAVAIAQRVVWRHGGRIWADSVPGRRTSVHFTLAPK